MLKAIVKDDSSLNGKEVEIVGFVGGYSLPSGIQAIVIDPYDPTIFLPISLWSLRRIVKDTKQLIDGIINIDPEPINTQSMMTECEGCSDINGRKCDLCINSDMKH